MTLVRWYNSYPEIDALRRQFDRLLDENLSAVWGDRDTTFTPAAELHTTAEAVIVRFALPGIDRESLKVEAMVKSLTVRGDRPAPTDTEGAERRSEFRYGAFARTVPLPVRVKNTEASVDYTDGILTVTLPKADEEVNQVITLNLQS